MKGLAALSSLWARQRPPIGSTPADVVHSENKWRLLRYRPRAGGPRFRTPLVLVPSLINRHYVLDLLPGKSFTEYLVGAGHDVYCIDWGTPGDEDRWLGFDDIADGYIGRAVRIAARASAAGRAHLCGYCLGGTLTAIYAAARPERVASLTTLASPIRFEGAGLLAAWSRAPTFDVGAMIEAFGNVPWQLMQSAFQMLRPTLALSKTMHALDRAWTDESLDGFVALETWGADNVSFPGECYRRYVEELYRNDALVSGTFTLSGRPARLEDIRCPVLAVTCEQDHIVPWPSAAELVDRVSATDKRRIHLAGGHVGAVVSQKAAKTLWPELSAWWAARDGSESRGVVDEDAPRVAPPQRTGGRPSKPLPKVRSRSYEPA